MERLISEESGESAEASKIIYWKRAIHNLLPTGETFATIWNDDGEMKKEKFPFTNFILSAHELLFFSSSCEELFISRAIHLHNDIRIKNYIVPENILLTLCVGGGGTRTRGKGSERGSTMWNTNKTSIKVMEIPVKTFSTPRGTQKNELAVNILSFSVYMMR